MVSGRDEPMFRDALTARRLLAPRLSRDRERFDPHKRPLIFSRQNVQEAIGALTHIPNALLQLAEY